MTTPLSIPAGVETLREHGYTGGLTKMVIEQALSLHSRGEEAKAERKATDATFNGIDITTWKVVLQSAIDAVPQTQVEAQVETVETASQIEADAPLQGKEDPFGNDEVDPRLAEDAYELVEPVGSQEDDEPSLSALYRQVHASQAKDPAPEPAPVATESPMSIDPVETLQDVWQDVPAVPVQPPADLVGGGAHDITITRAITAADVLSLLAEHHSSDRRRDCGAQTQPLPCKYTNGRTSHVYHCTEEPGHVGLHKDSLHCWSFESFGDDMVVQHAPRDLARCNGCQALGLTNSWPCAYSKELAEVARHFGIDLSQQG